MYCSTADCRHNAALCRTLCSWGQRTATTDLRCAAQFVVAITTCSLSCQRNIANIVGEGSKNFVCWNALEVGPFNLSTRRVSYWRGLLRILWKLWRRFVDNSTCNPAPASLLIKLYWLRGSYFNLHLSFGVKTKRQEPMSVIRNNRLNIWTTHNAHSRALLRTAHSRASTGVSCSAILHTGSFISALNICVKNC